MVHAAHVHRCMAMKKSCLEREPVAAKARQEKHQFKPLESRQTVDPAGLLRLRQVLAIYPVSASTWWNGVRSGHFPRPVKLSPNTTAWRARDVLALIENVPESRGASTGLRASQNDEHI